MALALPFCAFIITYHNPVLSEFRIRKSSMDILNKTESTIFPSNLACADIPEKYIYSRARIKFFSFIIHMPF